MIDVYHNVLSEEKRLRLLSEVKRHYQQLEGGFPSYQTHPDLHLHISPDILQVFQELTKFTRVCKCWSLFTHVSGESEWHTHQFERSSVYYLYNPEGLGTEFDDGRIDYPQNTLITFPGHLRHRPPDHINKPRHSFVIDYETN